MKKSFFFFSLLLIGMLMTSCDIEDTDDNGIVVPRNPPGCGVNGLACPG